MLSHDEMIARYDRPGPRYTSYPTALEFGDFTESDAFSCLEQSRQENGPISVYVHLPFCEQRCLYCACNVVINPDGRAAQPYLESLRREIDLVAERLGRGRLTPQLHFGGGTPTFYSAQDLKALVDHLQEAFTIADGAEVAIELDPRVTSPEQMETLAACGFNRISLGVQSFDPQVQESVRRVQSLEDTARLIQQARGLGIDNVNIDLIYGLPHQTVATFTRTIQETLSLRPKRLAIYSFAYLPSLKGHQRKLPAEFIPEGQEKLDIAEAAKALLLDAGYVAIGLDHFALPEDELCIAQEDGRLSRNFMGYTTQRAPEMVGLGLSAIGYIGNAFIQNTRHLLTYEKTVDSGHLPVERGLLTTPDDRVRAHVIRELMCNLRMSKQTLAREFGIDFDATLGTQLRRPLDALIEDGLLVEDEETVLVTSVGRVFVRNIAMLFDAYRTTDANKTFSRTI